MELVLDVYKSISNFPESEKYGLVSQIKRSAISIPSNIAEGAGRNSDKEFIQFLGYTNGSSCELETQIIMASELGFLEKATLERLNNKITEIQKMSFSLIKSLK